MFTGYTAYMPQYIIVRLIVLIFLALIIDLYFRHSLKLVLRNTKLALIRKGIPKLAAILFVCFFLFVVGYLAFLFKSCENETAHNYLFLITTLFVLLYAPKLSVLLFQFISNKKFKTNTTMKFVFGKFLI